MALLSFGAAGDAQLLSAARGVAWLVEAEFDVTLRLSTLPGDVTIDGATWQGLGQFLQVAPTREAGGGGTTGVTISLSLVNEAMLAATLGNVEGYRGRALRLYLQLFTENMVPVGDKKLRWSGYMNTARTKGSKIELPCSRAGLARSRKASPLRLTNAQQTARYPGDRGLEYLQDLIDRPSLWLSKRFQEV
jgi:hypothetical protein